MQNKSKIYRQDKNIEKIMIIKIIKLKLRKGEKN